MPRFKLSFFCIDEANDTIDSVTEGHFDTVEAAIDRADNVGSRWIFYPYYHVIDTETGEVVYTVM